MKRQLFMMVCGLMAMVAAEGQSLIETPNRKGIDLIDGFMKYVRSLTGQQNK